jgi:hypothetical protein
VTEVSFQGLGIIRVPARVAAALVGPHVAEDEQVDRVNNSPLPIKLMAGKC